MGDNIYVQNDSENPETDNNFPENDNILSKKDNIFSYKKYNFTYNSILMADWHGFNISGKMLWFLSRRRR